MKAHSRLVTPRWWLPIGIVGVIAAHVIFFDRLHHAGLSLAAISGLVVLAIAKHLGLLGPLYSLLRRRSRNKTFEGL